MMSEFDLPKCFVCINLRLTKKCGREIRNSDKNSSCSSVEIHYIMLCYIIICRTESAKVTAVVDK